MFNWFSDLNYLQVDRLIVLLSYKPSYKLVINETLIVFIFALLSCIHFLHVIYWFTWHINHIDVIAVWIKAKFWFCFM